MQYPKLLQFGNSAAGAPVKYKTFTFKKGYKKGEVATSPCKEINLCGFSSLLLLYAWLRLPLPLLRTRLRIRSVTRRG